MCLAIPGRVEKLDEAGKFPRMAEVDSGGIKRSICIDFLPDIKIGEYVLVHVGYALEKINEKEAKEQLESFRKAEDIIAEKLK